MSKLKLYTSLEDLDQDLAITREKLIEYGDSWFKDPIYQMRYVTDFDAILSAENLATQYEYFDRFSRAIDGKFANEGWASRDKRNEKDLIKYQLLCTMELKALLEPGVPNSKAAAEYLVKIKNDGRQEADFKDFLGQYKDECTKYAVGYEGFKEVEKIHNQINATFVRLDKQMPSPENKKLVAAIVKDNNKILDHAVGDVGKRTWSQFLGDMWDDIKKPIIKLVHSVMNAISPPVVEKKLPNSPPPLPKTPAPLFVREESILSAPPPIPNFPPELEMPEYAPPPIPKFPPLGIAVPSFLPMEIQDPNIVGNEVAQKKLAKLKFPKGITSATNAKRVDKVQKRIMDSNKSPMIIQ